MNARSNTPYILTFFICFLLWLLLTGSFKNDELIAGIVVSIIVSAISSKKLMILNGIILAPKSLIALLRYLGYFLVALLKANLDLAGRILSRKIPIEPTMIEITTTMESDLGKLLLANSITLTPGTLTVDVVDDRLLIHWIDFPKGMSLTEATQTIASGFETRLKGFLK